MRLFVQRGVLSSLSQTVKGGKGWRRKGGKEKIHYGSSSSCEKRKRRRREGVNHLSEDESLARFVSSSGVSSSSSLGAGGAGVHTPELWVMRYNGCSTSSMNYRIYRSSF